MKRHPEGLRTLFFTELWERFSYYGMRALLVIFMVSPPNTGGLGLSTENAALVYGNYTMAVYMLAIPGGLIADRWIGPTSAVFLGGLIIALGHFTLAYPSLLCFYLGLIFIALGTGLFKPSISVLVGNLYQHNNDLRDAGFSIFYMGINIGAFFAPLITGFLAQSTQFKFFLEEIGFNPNLSFHFGFASAGIGMLFGLSIYFKNISKFENVQRQNRYVREEEFSLTTTNALALLFLTGFLGILFLLSDYQTYSELRYLIFAFPLIGIIWFVSVGTTLSLRFAAALVFLLCSVLFWAIFEQAGLSIALFAEKLTRTEIFGVSFPSSWF
ncbi:MAG: peptide MFS transporter [Hyphomicrobium sp.]